MITENRLQLILSDLHVLSTVGIWPEDFVSTQGVPIGQTKYQKLLWKLWVHAWDWAHKVIGGDPFDIIINGDLVEGIHHKTIEVMSPDRGDQIAAVEQVLRPQVGYDSSIYIVMGTESHTRNDELVIGKELKAHVDPATGNHAFRRLELELPTGILLSATHHMPTTKRTWLEASQLSLELQNEVAERTRRGLRPPQIIVRAHRHVHGFYSNGSQMACVTGAWQGLTRYGTKVVPHAVCSPSMIILDSRLKEQGELPTVHEKLLVAEQ